MSDPGHLAALVAWLAFALAFVFGAVAKRVDFCTMGAITDVVHVGDWRRMRMWLLAIAVAIAGAAGLEAAGLVDLSKTIYTGSRIAWLSLLVGGFLFGFGMTLASGCGSKTLIRLGGGNLKALVVLIVLGISAYMTLKGLFAVWRVNALDVVRWDLTPLGVSRSDLGTLVAQAIGGAAAVRLAAALLVAAAIAAFVLASRDFRDSPSLVLGGIVIGAVIVGGWYVSGHLGHVAEDPRTLEEAFVATNTGRAESFSFVAPVAYLLELLLLWSDTSRIVTFGIAGVLGMAAGSAAMALATRTFRWEGFAGTEDLVNHIGGGVLMGFGGVTALGCTIGQGLTGVSTLAIGSFIALGAIVAGCVTALKYQYWRLDAVMA
ncbi:MAG TPA: YeeE/YedE family protein [Casimicrobiaceae bacterium]|nr:YeeE/YedE family protein [Casimicrobiaceae bacterium]